MHQKIVIDSRRCAMNAIGQPKVPPIGLPPEQFAAAFPFHFAMDQSLQFLQVGPALRRLCPEVLPGTPLNQAFKAIRPPGGISLKWVQNNRNHFFLLENRTSKLRLRGGFMPLPGTDIFLFLGSPWFTDASEIAVLGLKIEDFAIHDPVADMLQVFQANKTALDDARKLAEKLTAQRAELRIANERLQQQEAETRKLALIAERTDNAVVLTDPEGKVVWINSGFTRLTGYTLDETVGQRPGSLLQGPETDPATVQHMRQQLGKGEGFKVELINYHKSGRKYWLASQTQPVRNEAGQIVNFMAIQRDITERKEAEATLLAEVVRRRTLFDQSADGIVIIDPQTARFSDFNTAAHEQLGYSREEFARLSISDVEHLETQADIQARITGVMQNGREDFETLQLNRQGEIRNVHVTAKIVKVLGQTVYQCIWRDITGRKQVEKKLHQLSLAVEQSPVSIVITDAAGLIEYVNPKCTAITGYSQAELLGQNPRVLKSGDATPSNYRELWKTITAGKDWRGEFHNKKKNGELYWEDAFISPMRDSDGRITNYLAIKEDITERKHAENALRESKRFLQSALDALTAHIAILDEDGTIIEVNAAWNRFAQANGLKGNQRGVGDNYLKICDSACGICSEEASVMAAGIRAVIAGHTREFHLEYPCHSPNEQRWFYERVTRFAGDGPVRVVVAHENITERKTAESQLLQVSTLQRAMLEGAGYAIIATNTAGVIQLFNPAAERLLSYNAGEMVGQQSPAVFHLPNEVVARAKELTAELGRVVMPGFDTFTAKSELGQPDQREWTYVRKDGSHFPVLLSVTTLFDAHGKITGHLGIASDLTERKRNEEKLRTSYHELERFNLVMINRERRVLELKLEINALLAAAGRSPAYPSATAEPAHQPGTH